MQWQGRRVLITGHTGFKGAWLALWLQQLGAEVTGLALPPQTVPDLFTTARVGDGMRSILGDIRDASAVDNAFQEARPEIVFHMAAQALVRSSYSDPVATYSTNVMGTVHVLDAVRRSPPTRAIVVVTSDKCYENREWVWPYRESDTLGGHDPYSSSKGCAELVTASFRSSFFTHQASDEHGVAVASARAGNVLGGGDWALDRLVPDAIRAFSRKATLEIRNPYAVRPWQHVLEPLRGYLVLAEALFEQGVRFAGPWNFGPSVDAVQPVTAVVTALANWWPGAQWEVTQGQHPHEANTLCLDCSKARAELKWSAALRFEQAIEETAAWYARFYAGKDARALCLEQLSSYQASAAAQLAAAVP